MARKSSNEVLERRIREAFVHVTPNSPSSVLLACDQSVGKGRILMTTQGKGRIAPIVRRVAGIAAALVLTCGVAVGVYAYQSNVAVASTVSLDVNPSVEIATNKNEKVLSVTALNADGEIIIGDMSLKGSDLDVAVNALIGSMVQNGYINEVSNSILLTVDGKNEEKNAVICEKLVEKINEVLKTDALDGAVLSQTIGATESVKALAEEYGISKGKAQLISQITLQNTRYSFEELVKLTINELNLLSESGATKLENVDLSGVASDKKYIGEEAALTAALAHAEAIEADVTELECELDFEHGKMVYEIEFVYDGYEYEYTVDAESSEIVKQSKKLPHGHEHQEGIENGNKPEEVGCIETHITAEDALAKALAHAGIAADAALEDAESKLSRKRGECVYKVEFELDGYEYEYLIDASTGDVVKYEKELADEPDDKHEKPEDGHGQQNGKPEFESDECPEEMTRPEKPEMPEGEESVRPEKPEMPEGEESVRPERPEMPEGEETAQPARPEKPEMPEGELPPIPEEETDAVSQGENGDFGLQPMRR